MTKLNMDSSRIMSSSLNGSLSYSMTNIELSKRKDEIREIELIG